MTLHYITLHYLHTYIHTYIHTYTHTNNTNNNDDDDDNTEHNHNEVGLRVLRWRQHRGGDEVHLAGRARVSDHENQRKRKGKLVFWVARPCKSKENLRKTYDFKSQAMQNQRNLRKT